MKFNKSIILTVLLISSVAFLSSCKSTKVEEKDPYFLADMDPFYLESIVGYNKANFFKPKATNFDIWFYPRSSIYSMDFKDGLYTVRFEIMPENVGDFKQAIETYLNINKEGKFDPNHKPSRKNFFNRGKIRVVWGLTGGGRVVETSYETNYEYLEDKPYFKIYVKSTNVPGDDHSASPYQNLYFAPNQLEKLLEITSKDLIQVEIDKFNQAISEF